jgi:hypothetical protein
MAVQRFAEGAIAGITTDDGGDPTMCFIEDGAVLKSGRFVQIIIASDGTPFTRGMGTGLKGKRFKVRFPHIRTTKFNAMVDNIVQAGDNQETFSVNLTDENHIISSDCKADGSDWLSYPTQEETDGIFMDNVTML